MQNLNITPLDKNQPVDLHGLHFQVVQEGGIKQKDIWNIIGSRLGFFQFPCTETDPAKSGPSVAQQPAHTYKEYLAQFDHFYIGQIVEQRQKQQQASATLQAQMTALRWNPAQMQAVVHFSLMPVSELHAQAVPQKMIQFIEAHRAALQRTLQDQNKSSHNR
ncbi:hypothetical protein B0H34DRAFT_801509 [Crassisporium funariophilum]|nr:hypothetical protein B0H34DRAFT_801509 [Crassisporium funariophilum]